MLKVIRKNEFYYEIAKLIVFERFFSNQGKMILKSRAKNVY